VLLLIKSFNIMEIKTQPIWFTVLIIPLAIIWFIRCLAETNRAPFDLAEGESELVSGFNIEYGGGEFAFLFIAEYGSILLIRILTSALFLSGVITGFGVYPLAKIIFIVYLFLWVRGSYPRMRYDTLISLTWKSFLTIAISVIALILSYLLKNSLKNDITFGR
jgi:NADH-ubiquinone oxidoreductase chain 1